MRYEIALTSLAVLAFLTNTAHTSDKNLWPDMYYYTGRPRIRPIRIMFGRQTHLDYIQSNM